MTTTPPEAPAGPPPADGPPPGGPRVSGDDIKDLGRLRRSATDRKVAGVAGGLARHLDVDPIILRVAFVVLVFFGGAGLILYGACWLLVPDEADGRAAVTLDDRSRTVALLVVGVLAALALVGDSWGVFWFPWPVALLALIVWLVLSRTGKGSSSPAPPPTFGPTSAPVPPPYGAAPHAPAPDGPYGPADPSATATLPTAPVTPPPTWTPPPAASGTPYPPLPPPNPRKKGPILFWFTLALIVFAEGVLGMVDLAGANVADGAYPALAVGITGAMLVVGAFWGRAGGLILLGLLSTIGLVGATAADNYEGRAHTARPDTSAEVRNRYSFGAGEYVVDLTAVQDVAALDGRTIELEGGVGRIEVVLPDNVDVDAHGQVGGPGAVDLFGEETGGVANEMSRTQDVPDEVATITIDAQLGVGQIEVRTR